MQRRNVSQAIFLFVLAGAGALIVFNWIHIHAKPHRPAANVYWRDPTSVEVRLARSAIGGQLRAFKAGDYDAAYRYLTSYSPDRPAYMAGFRAQMLTVPIFTEYKSYRFGDMQAQSDGSMMQAMVYLSGGNGTVMSTFYTLELKNGTYRIQAFRPINWTASSNGKPGGSPTAVAPPSARNDAALHAALAGPMPPTAAQQEAMAQSQAALAARMIGTPDPHHGSHGDLH